MKILITGAGGQLGKELVRVFKKKFQVIATDKNSLDFTNKKQTVEVTVLERPDFVIHAGAWTDVDGCAKEPKKAMVINGEGTRNVAEAVKNINAKLIYISTNEVFDGQKKSPYLEMDYPNPITPYGKSKRLGETYAETVLGPDCSIVRVAWLYGPASTTNFPHKIVNRAREQGFLKVVEDEISTPTYTPDLAEALEKLIRKSPSGIFHLVNGGFASRFEWAELILELTKMTNVKIKPIKLQDFERDSKPPNYTVLKNERSAKLGVVLRDWKSACADYIETSGLINYNHP